MNVEQATSSQKPACDKIRDSLYIVQAKARQVQVQGQVGHQADQIIGPANWFPGVGRPYDLDFGE